MKQRFTGWESHTVSTVVAIYLVVLFALLAVLLAFSTRLWAMEIT